MAYVKNTWVDREGQTRYHETIDDDGALIFTPDYEKVTEIGTPVNADNMNHIEDGIVDHENRITVLEEAGDASNFLNKSQITNCILEVPQNIKLELNNGTLTLKSGSKVIVPNGVGIFNEIIVSEDKSITITSNGTHFITYNSVNKLAFNSIFRATSGTTAPTTAGYWYDTAENKVKFYDGTSIVSTYYSFPIAIVTVDNGVLTSIDQVFNGFGYIGSHIWMDKGVKVLIPSGRNADGTLKNIEYTTNTVAISDRSVLDGENRAFLFNYMRNTLEDKVYGEDNKTIAGSGQYIYNPITNNIYNSGGQNSRWVLCGYYSASNGQITNLQPKLPLRAVDYNDLENYVKGMPVGTVFSHTCSASFVPENSLPCNGSEYTQAQFPNLYNEWLVGGKLKTCTYTEYSNMLTTYGQCPMWALDTTNKKFKVPTIKDGAVVQQAMSNSEIGKAYNAGLPNITGSVSSGHGYLLSGDGAFTALTSSRDWQGTGSASALTNFDFDASRSNPIYGNSDTVQMNAVALRYFVVVATKAINQSAMDWSNWASSLNGKLNADHSNDTKPYIIQTYVNGASRYRVWSDKWCEQGSYLKTTSTGTVTINLLKDFVNTNYGIQLTEAHTGLISDARTVNQANKTTSSFQIFRGSSAIPIYWEAKGYIA